MRQLRSCMRNTSDIGSIQSIKVFMLCTKEKNKTMPQIILISLFILIIIARLRVYAQDRKGFWNAILGILIFLILLIWGGFFR